MDPLQPAVRNVQLSLLSRPTSAHPTSPSPPAHPSNDDIEAIIQMATSARHTPDGRSVPIKDTRTQLFVGNLPYRVRWQDLKDLFRRAGTVLRADVSLGPDNRSRGYGTVLLATAEDAGRAIDMFHGYSWQTRILEVRPDRLPPDFDNPPPVPPLPPPTSFSTPSSTALASPLTSANHLTSPPRNARTLSEELDFNSFFGSEAANASSTTHRNLFVGNLPFHCQWQDLKDLFRQAGTIIRADVTLGPDGRSRGFGTVVFATEQDAERAVKMFHGYEYNGRSLKVHVDRYSHLSQPSASPTHGTFHQAMLATHMGQQPSFTTSMTNNRPNHITLPTGYHSEFLPPSGPPSPYDLYQTNLSMLSQQHSHSQSQQQAQQLPSRSQQLTSPQPPSRDSNDSWPINEVDTMTTKFAATSILTKPGLISPSQSKKSVQPSTNSSNQSSSNTTSSDNLPNNLSASAQLEISKTQIESENFNAASQTPPQSQQQQQPKHPGPISLPPPTLSFVAPHTLSPLMHHHQRHQHQHHHLTGMPIPIHHPNMGSPLHHPSSSNYPTAPVSHHQQIIAMTPHGLPITPSMPPFIFHPMPPPSGSPTMNTSAHTPSAAAAHMSMFGGTGGGPPSFSPTVAMSPGTFWGRPGNQHPNPFINPAVGAPVHVHSSDTNRQAASGTSAAAGGGDRSGGGGGGDGSGGGVSVNVNMNMNMNIGGSAYFYAPPGPGRVEPTGYFDPVYFPPGAQHSTTTTMATGGSAGGGRSGRLMHEVLKEESESGQGEGDASTEAGKDIYEDMTTPSTGGLWSPSTTNDDEDEDTADVDDIIGCSASQDSTSGGTNTTTTTTFTFSEASSWYNSEESGDDEQHAGKNQSQKIGSGASIGLTTPMGGGGEKRTISRTHSMSGGLKPSVFLSPATLNNQSSSDLPTGTASSGWPAPMFASLSSQTQRQE